MHPAPARMRWFAHAQPLYHPRCRSDKRGAEPLGRKPQVAWDDCASAAGDGIAIRPTPSSAVPQVSQARPTAPAVQQGIAESETAARRERCALLRRHSQRPGGKGEALAQKTPQALGLAGSGAPVVTECDGR